MSKQMSHEKCEHWLEAISDYIDGELPARTCDELEAHLANCPDCTLLVNTTKKSIALAQRLISRQMPEEIKGRLLVAICEANIRYYSDNDLRSDRLADNLSAVWGEGCRC